MTKLQYWRIEKGMTREELGEKSGLSGTTVMRIERGDAAAENVRIGTLANLAKALNVKLTDIIEDEFLV